MRDIEHFSEFKMAAATILDVWKVPIIFPVDLQGRVITNLKGFSMVASRLLTLYLDTGSRSRSNQSSNVKLGNFNISLLILSVRHED